jgi:hypothetical protein
MDIDLKQPVGLLKYLKNDKNGLIRPEKQIRKVVICL